MGNHSSIFYLIQINHILYVKQFCKTKGANQYGIKAKFYGGKINYIFRRIIV